MAAGDAGGTMQAPATDTTPNMTAARGESSEMSLCDLSANAAAAKLAAGEITSEALVIACLERIAAREDAVQAWTYLEPEYAYQQAKAADAAREAGAPIGPLHGLPVGVKDIFDTEGMPTENGSALHAGRKPRSDATAVALLRQAGAIVMGKTVTTEFALYAPGKTANPHDPERTPGGSSSGSAAAVATGMVPLALGTQTNGSVIRPASFCGVFGYKPTHGLISRRGVLPLSRPLDTVGVFARTVPDLALAAEPLMAYDDGDPDMRPSARPPLVATATTPPPVTPRLAFVKTAVWDQADVDTQEGFAELVAALGDHIEEVPLPELFDGAVGWHRSIMYPDVAKSLAPEYANGKDRLSGALREIIEEGGRCLAVDYNRAVDWITVLNTGLDELFQEFDAVITPAAPGEAPIGLDSTGSPIFCSLWTLCGTPALSAPLLQGGNGMPIGVQIVGPRGDDARLLRTANWLVERLAKVL